MGGRGTVTGIVKTQTQLAAHKQESNYSDSSSPTEASSLSSVLGSPAQGSCTRKMSPQNVWL